MRAYWAAFNLPVSKLSIAGLSIRSILGSVVLVAISWVAIPARASDSQAMQEIIVSMPLHRHATEQAAPVAALRGEQLRRRVAATLGETLASMPGVANASFGTGVGQPVIRGHAGPRVSMLVNGLPAADVSSVSPDHAVSVEPALADAIEVLRGPSTLLFGSGAIGGVVNTIDKRIASRAVQGVDVMIETRHATASDEQAYVGSVDLGLADLGMQNTVLHIDAVDRSSNNTAIPGAAITRAPASGANTRGYLANSNTNYLSRGVGLSQVFEHGFAGVAISTTDNDYGIPPGEQELANGERIRIVSDQRRSELRGGYTFERGAVETLRLFLSNNDYEHSELEFVGDQVESGTQFSSDTDSLRVELVHNLVSGVHGAAGVDASRRDFSVLGEEAYLPAVEHDSRALFLVEKITLQPLQLELGTRVERNDFATSVAAQASRNTFTTQSFSLAVLRELSPRWQASLVLGRAERAPTSEELFSNAGNDNNAATSGNDLVPHVATKVVERGNVNLRPEQSSSIDVRLRYARGETNLQLSGYYNDFNRYIALLDSGEVDLNDGLAIFDYHATGARFYGAELEFDRALGNALGGDIALHGFADWVAAKRSGGTDLPRLPPARVSTALEYTRAPLTMQVSALHALSRRAEPGAARTAAYTRWDLNIEYQPSGAGALALAETLTLFARVKNLPDETIREASSFLRDIAPASGRSVELGLRLAM